MDGCVVDLEGLRGKSNRFVAKELSVATFVHGVPSNTATFTFKPPYGSDELSPCVKRTNRWVTFNGHHLRWNDGDLPYSALPGILNNLGGPFYVKGGEKALFVYNIIGKFVHELGDLGCPKVANLNYYRPACANHPRETTNCAETKAQAFCDWIVTNLDGEPSYLL